MKPPCNVHHSCDCRDRRAKQMEAALKVILTLVEAAKVTEALNILEDVERKCREVLNGKP